MSGRAKNPLDPYLERVKESLMEAKEYLECRRVPLKEVVKRCHDAVMTTLQRMVIDKKGMTVLEQLRKEKKLYFNTLVSILKEEGVEINNLNELEILRERRNMVEHEWYRPTEHEAEWAYDIAKSFVLQNYPEIFQEERESVPPPPTPHKDIQYVVFEDLDKATGPKVHSVDCPYYKKWQNNPTTTTTWHGPYKSFEEAWRICEELSKKGLFKPSKHGCIRD